MKSYPYVIDCAQVTFTYDYGNPVLRDVNFRVPEGEFLALMGPNGGGKTTLLNLCIGLLSSQ